MASSISAQKPQDLKLIPLVLKEKEEGKPDKITKIFYLNCFALEKIQKIYPLTSEGLFVDNSLEDPISLNNFNILLQKSKPFVVISSCGDLKHCFEAHGLLEALKTNALCPLCRADLKDLVTLLQNQVDLNDAQFFWDWDSIKEKADTFIARFSDNIVSIYENHSFLLITGLCFFPFLFFFSTMLNVFILNYYFSIFLVILNQAEFIIEETVGIFACELPIISLILLFIDTQASFICFVCFLSLHLALFIQTLQFLLNGHGPNYSAVLLRFWSLVFGDYDRVR